MRLRGLPLLASFGYRRTAGVVANIEVAFAFGIFSVVGSQLLGFCKEHIGIRHATVLKCKIAHHQIRLGIFGELNDRVFQFSPGRRQLIHAQPKHGHHHARRRHLDVVRFDAFEDRPAAVDVAVAKAIDGSSHFRVCGIVGDCFPNQGLSGDLRMGNRSTDNR